MINDAIISQVDAKRELFSQSLDMKLSSELNRKISAPTNTDINSHND